MASPGLEGEELTKGQPTTAWKRMLEERSLRGRFGLFNWIRANYAELSASRADLKLSWEDVAAAARSEGLTDATGHSPTAETVRRTWLRVEQTIIAPAAPTPPTPEPGATAALSAPPVGAGPSPGQSGHGEQRPRNTFAIARLKRPPEEQH
jgi:hypothetical protein